MPVHDWGTAFEDIFHAFALSWLVEQKAWLNRHSNGNGIYALLAPAF